MVPAAQSYSVVTVAPLLNSQCPSLATASAVPSRAELTSVIWDFVLFYFIFLEEVENKASVTEEVGGLKKTMPSGAGGPRLAKIVKVKRN